MSPNKLFEARTSLPHLVSGVLKKDEIIWGFAFCRRYLIWLLWVRSLHAELQLWRDRQNLRFWRAAEEWVHPAVWRGLFVYFLCGLLISFGFVCVVLWFFLSPLADGGGANSIAEE